MDNLIWQIRAWLVETGWNLGQAWDSIGGWDGALRWIVAGVIVGCIGWMVYFLIREYKRAPLVEETIEEPITQPLQAVSPIKTFDASKRDALRMREGVIPVDWALEEIYEFCEEQAQKRGEQA